jgi:methionyl-tRNA synthetase
MSFYITTPLYYVNDTPHIGHAYTTIVVDVISRYQRLFGNEVFFLTGTDEHGQKIENAAKKRGKTPQQHCDEMVVQFQDIWKQLQIQEDFFIRTTMDFHKKAVQDCLQELWDKGEIYDQDYEGFYCESEEIFYTEKDLVNGKTPEGKDVQLIKEKNYFFKMSKYQQQLIDHIEKNPNFIQPQNRTNEILGFLKKPLGDLSISRPKSRLNWGVEIPFDRDHVTYVWFDALLNYATAIGFKQSAKQELFKKFWPETIHVIGKDILMTHAVYWTTMLMALGQTLPKTIFAHGWWLTEENEKMSKSKGSVVKPLDVKDIVGVHGIRYFLTRDITFGNDAQFKTDLVVGRVNTDLANKLGNLLSRSTNLIDKFFGAKTPPITENIPATKELKKSALLVAGKVKAAIDELAPQKAIEEVMALMDQANKYLEDTEPWKAAKTDLALAGESLSASVEVLRVAGILLHPVMPDKCTELLARIGYSKTVSIADATNWGLSSGSTVAKGDPLFPRIDWKA